MEKPVCIVEGCPFEGGYCRVHPSGSLKKPKPIKKLSEKRKIIQTKTYIPLVKEKLAEHPNCKVKSPVCTGKAEGLHHIQGREGKNLTDKKKVVPCCNPCNQFIEKNDAYARAHGWKLSKHANYKRTK